MIICICANVSDKTIVEKYDDELTLEENVIQLRYDLNIAMKCGKCKQAYIEVVEKIKAP